ncbi:MAG: glycoside hydrolase family 31 protein [Polyangiaceae bacterium]
MNQRGKVRAMQIVPEAVESSYNDAHVPIPLLIGTRGWGVLVESERVGVFAPGVTDPTKADIVFGTGNASTDGLQFDLLGAAHPLDVTAHYYDLTGYPHRAARWALGPLIWRNENTGQAQVLDDAKRIRDLDLATTAVWIDRPYATGVQTFDFDPARYDDTASMIDTLHDLGLRVSLWHSPYIDEQDPTTAQLLGEADAAGYYPSAHGLLFNKWGRPLDLTNPDAVAWWQQHLDAYRALGIEGYKLDYGEDVVPGFGNARTPWAFFDGSDERTMHARFQSLYHQTYAAKVDEGESFLICRASRLGDQKNLDVIWPGDLDASFSKRGDQMNKNGDKYVSVGGLPASVIAGLSLGPSGFPLYGADTGGYRHAPPDKELFIRWFEQTALSTVMQVGTASSDVPWEGTAENGFDQEVLDTYRKFARLHLRLFPYVYSYLDRLYSDGRPIARPLGLAFPELGIHPDDTYMLGDGLLVSPVLERGVTSKDVPLPNGRWIGWFDGSIHEGGGSPITVDAPLTALPLFQREGTIVPLLRPTIDTMSPVADTASIDSFATRAGALFARVFAGPESELALFDGTKIRQRKEGASLTIETTSGAEFSEGFQIELVGIGEKIGSVSDDEGDVPQAQSEEALSTTSRGWIETNEGQRIVSLRVTNTTRTIRVGLTN